MSKQVLAVSFAAVILLAACPATDAGRDTGENSKRVELESEGWKLVGTLEMPEVEGPVPAVLLAHQFNRDRTVYAKLAGLLAERGIASLRIDLRGHGESTNLGGIDRRQLTTSWPDIVVAFKYLKQLDGIDHNRIGLLGASYTGEAVARAGREAGYGKAYVILSAGGFSEESIAALDGSGAAWWFIAARDDGRRTPALMERAAGAAAAAELTMYDQGGHAANLFGPHPDLEEKIADWFAEKLK